MDQVRLDGKTVIVTGSNTGIGKQTAKVLASKGAKVILACRSEERADAARQDITSETGNDKVFFRQLDLASLQSVRDFADKFNQEEDRLDLLVNNAGVTNLSRLETKDGFEMMFGVNHLGHFLLTNLLLDKMKACAPSRIVNLTSMYHRKCKVNFNDLQSEKKFSTLKAYGQSKTANILFILKLADVLKGTGVTTYAVHPGFVDTELARELECCCYCCKRCYYCLVSCWLCLPLIQPEEGALTTLYCSLEPSIATHSGRYYSDSKEALPAPHARSQKDADRLWTVSEELCGLK